MLHRLAAILITAFWVIMWALLIRTELEPEGASLRAVPVEHVLKLMFHHQQSSDLSLRNEGKLIGHLRLIPRVMPEDQSRVLDYSGSLRLRLPGAERQRFSWIGESIFDPTLNLQRLTVNFTIHQSTLQEGADTQLSFAFDAATKAARYEIRTGQTILEKQEFAATEEGLKNLIRRAGFDPGVVQTITPTGNTPPQITAKRSTFRLHGEEIDTLLLTMEYNGQTMFQVHISQLGQVLSAKTVLGWTLESD